MPTARVQAVIEQVRQLLQQEQEELRALLDAAPPPESQPATDEERRKIDELNRRLREKGLLLNRPEPTPEELEAFRKWKPTRIPGKPLSETIIEERR